MPSDSSLSRRQRSQVPSPEGLRGGLMLMDLFDQLDRVDSGVLRLVERTSGMRLGQTRVLRSVQLGARQPTAIADFIGEHPDAVVATLDSLRAMGYVVIAGAECVALTETGRARLDQLAGLLVRLHADRCAQDEEELVAAARVLARHVEDLEADVAGWLRAPDPSAVGI